ncbi:MAG: hypothetical protein R3B54_07380 [Bdellovibrionota bacterium]
MEDKQLDTSVEEAVTPGSALLGRLVWVMFGPMILLSFLVPIAHVPMQPSKWDVGYALNILLMIWGRYAEQKSGQAVTLYNEVSTWRHFKAYVVKLVLFAVFAWVATKLIFGPK